MPVLPPERSSICVYDFCGSMKWPGGSRLPASFWADWDGEQVVFGGDWSDVPPMRSLSEPTEEQCWEHARTYGAIMAGFREDR